MGYTGKWETYVNDVTLRGRPDLLRASARQWETSTRRVTEMGKLLDELWLRSESWKGGGGNATRGHLKAVREAATETVAKHHLISVALDACADQLTTAMLAVPIPGWLSPEVTARQDRAVRDGVYQPFAPGEFEKLLRARFPEPTGTLTEDQKAQVLQQRQEIQRALDEGEDRARAAYETLVTKYSEMVGQMPGGTPIKVPHVEETDAKTAKTDDAGKTGGKKTATDAAQTKAAQDRAAQQLAQQQAAQQQQQAAAQQSQLQNLLNGLNQSNTPTTPVSDIDTGTGTTLPDTDTDTDIDTDLDLDPLEPGTELAGGGAFTGADIGGGGGGAIGGGGGGGGVKLPIGESVATPAAVMAGTKTAGASVQGGSGGAAAGAGRTTTPGMMGGMMGGAGAAGLGGNQDASGGNKTKLLEFSGLYAPDEYVPSGVIDA
jgi:hypothetical protein